MSAPDFIVLDDDDTVATALRDVAPGATAILSGPRGALPGMTPASAIPLGHKIALRAIAPDDLVIKHGRPIGRATRAIAAGEHVHVHNVVSLSG